MKNITNNKLLNFLVLAIFAALPFERIPTLEFGGYTVKISYLIGIVLLFTFLFFNPIQFFKDNKLTVSDWVLILFWAVGAFTLLWASDFKRGLIIVLLWAFMFLLYLIFSRLLLNDRLRKKAEDITIFVSVLVCLFGLYQFFGDSLGLSARYTQILPQYSKFIFEFPRIQSTALEPLYFANFLLVPAFLITKRYLLKTGIFNSNFFLLIFLLVNIILTVSRGAYIAVVCSTILLLFYLLLQKSYEEKKKKVFGLILAGLISLCLCAVIVVEINGTKAATNFVSHTAVPIQNKNNDYSSLDRLDTYGQAVKLWKEKPLFGNGLGSFGVKVTPDLKKDQGIYQTVNNEYLEILSETGLIGLLLFLVFILLYLKEIFKNFKKHGQNERFSTVLLGLGLLAIFIQYNFFSTLYIIYLWVFLALLKATSLNEKIS